MEPLRCLANALGAAAGRASLVSALVFPGCGPSLAQNVTDVGLTCEQRQQRLHAVLSQMPSKALVSPASVQLPLMTLPTGVIRAPMLELSDAGALFEATPLAGANAAQWAEDFAARWASADPSSEQRSLLVAAEWNVDLTSLHWFLRAVDESTRVHLMFARPAAPDSPLDPKRYPLTQQVLLEPDAQQRVAVAERAYDEYSRCSAIDDAVRAVSGLTGPQRWPVLKERMLHAIPKCDCTQLDAEGLRHLLSAEQRAGSLGVGSVDVSFLRDLRCRARMPLRPVQEVLKEIEEFDTEFTGEWQAEALHFQDEVSEERLRNYVCVASAGDTLAVLQRDSATVYWKVGHECQAWRFLPLQRGAPMGTLQRLNGAGDLAVHYWQAVEDIRLYGPASDGGLPTDAGPWQCSEESRLQHVEQDWVELDNGVRWYFDAASCEQAAATHPRAGTCALSDFAKDTASGTNPDAPAPAPDNEP